MKRFVRENAATVLPSLFAMIVVSSLTGGSAGAAYLTAFTCLAVMGWRDKRKESRSKALLDAARSTGNH